MVYAVPGKFSLALKIRSPKFRGFADFKFEVELLNEQEISDFICPNTNTLQDIGYVFIWLDSKITLQHCIRGVSTRYELHKFVYHFRACIEVRCTADSVESLVLVNP